MKSNVESLIEKSIACAVSAIEIYNKPDFKYREETFSILMINSWELVLKAKLIKDANNNIKAIYIKENIPKKAGGKSKRWKYKLNKKGYNLTIGIEKLLEKYENEGNIDKRCLENIGLLNIVRNNAIHLINKDSLLMYVAYVFVWAMTLVWQLILRTGRVSTSSSKKSWWILIFWIAFLVLWYLFYPLVRLAISRKREYMADLWSVELTRDNQSMISALRKISSNSYVSKSNDSISSFFIANPKISIRDMAKAEYWLGSYASNKDWKTKTSIWDSHPSIDDRIARLEQY